MEYLEIKSRPRTAYRRVIGVILILLGAAYYISIYAGDFKIQHFLFSAAIICTGIYHFFNGFGLEKSWIRTASNSITIKSPVKLNSVTIHTAGIREIALTRFKVIIYRKSRLPFKFDVYFLENEQKSEVYKFMTDFAANKNLPVKTEF